MSRPGRRRDALIVALSGVHPPEQPVEQTVAQLRRALRSGADIVVADPYAAGVTVYRPRPRIRLTDVERCRR